MKTIFGIILSLYFSSNFVYSKLVVVHVLFRHGERTPDTFTMYPTDPYKNDTFYPYGTGQMTKEGKLTIFNLGRQLRNRYNDFIGEIYTPDVIDPWASYLPRTQMALQLLLASLFPPKDFQIWKSTLEWQPIPYHFLPKKNDYLLLGVLSDEFKQMYYEYCQTNAGQNAMKKAAPLFPYIRAHAKFPGKTTREFFFLYATLNSEYTFGLKLPKWTDKLYPHPLVDFTALEFRLQLATKNLKQKLIGKLMRKILSDTENHISGESKTKLHIYSAHDVNISYILILLGLMYSHVPSYGACLAIEVHEENATYYMQVLYKEKKQSDFKLLQFPNGADRMALFEFKKIVDDIYDIQGSSATSIITKPVIYLLPLLCCCFKNLYAT